MPLKIYHSKRDFKKTKEPKGKTKHTKKRNLFVIQKHAASRLHYDFRLEIDGVLKSWAVPKGPSLDPRLKRLAVETEDHPLDYANFEGTIPENEYGGGTVMIWDRGVYKNLKDDSLKKCYQRGLLEVYLSGKKIKGNFALKKFRTENKKSQWLLIKMKDEYADARRNPTSTQNRSVKSGKTMYQIEKQVKDDGKK